MDLPDKNPDTMLETSTEFLTAQKWLSGARCLLVMVTLSTTSKTE